MRPETCSAKCEKCGTNLWSRRRGEWTLANRIIKMTKGGSLAAKCPECGDLVGLPFLHLRPPESPKPTRRRLVIRVDTDPKA